MCGCSCFVSTKWYALHDVTHLQSIQIQRNDHGDGAVVGDVVDTLGSAIKKPLTDNGNKDNHNIDNAIDIIVVVVLLNRILRVMN
jgi:hypothetical protein